MCKHLLVVAIDFGILWALRDANKEVSRARILKPTVHNDVLVLMYYGRDGGNRARIAECFHLSAKWWVRLCPFDYLTLRSFKVRWYLHETTLSLLTFSLVFPSARYIAWFCALYAFGKYQLRILTINKLERDVFKKKKGFIAFFVRIVLRSSQSPFWTPKMASNVRSRKTKVASVCSQGISAMYSFQAYNLPVPVERELSHAFRATGNYTNQGE